MSRTNWYSVWKRKQARFKSGHKEPIHKSKLWMKIPGLILALVVAGIVFTLGVFIYIAKDLPNPDRVVRREGFSSRIYDREGTILYDVYSGQKRTPVELKDIPKTVRDATVAIEDKNFYTHAGVDPLTPFRIGYNLVMRQRVVGGSSLTQQLVKNALLTGERTVWRKIKEFILTLQVESRYSKDQILQMYLNEVPYGGTVYGVGAAAETFFEKKVVDLTLPEAAIIAGLPQSPSAYSPTSGTRYIDRAQDVLRRMREDGYISREEEENALELLPKVRIATQSGLLKAPHFVFYVKQILADKYGEQVVEEGGLQITTTLDLELQEKAQAIVADEVAKVKHLNIGNGAAIIMDPKTGEILAMVGSKGWEDPDYDGKFNVVTQGLRQPGSALKPVVYTAALRKGYTAATMIMDTQTSFPGGDKPEYVPVNYDGKWRGPVLVREALGNSLNIPAVKMVSLTGIKDMLEVAYEMGFSSLEPTTELLKRVGLSIALGGGEVRLIDMAAAYSAYANEGLKAQPTAILKVTDMNGKVLEDNTNLGESKQVLTPEEAYIISSILSDPEARKITFGTGSWLDIAGKTVAVKTGTTNDKKDNWTIGWTPGVLVGVWVGNNNNTSMKQVASGVTGASPIWNKIIKEALKSKADQQFVRPEGIAELEVDKVSGYLAHDGFETKKEIFIKGTEPWGDDPIHKKVKVCKGEGKLATPADAASGNYDEKEYLYLKEEDPFQTTSGKNTWQEGILNWLTTQADPKYHPPTDFCGSTNPIWVRIVKPEDKSRVNTRDVVVRVEVDDINPVRKVEIFLDGNLRYTNSSAPFEITIPSVTEGYHKIDVRAEDDKGLVGTRYVEISVNRDYSGLPTPTPSPTTTPMPED